MQARPIRWGPSSSSLSAEPQGAAQMTLTVDADFVASPGHAVTEAMTSVTAASGNRPRPAANPLISHSAPGQGCYTIGNSVTGLPPPNWIPLDRNGLGSARKQALLWHADCAHGREEVVANCADLDRIARQHARSQLGLDREQVRDLGPRFVPPPQFGQGERAPFHHVGV